ncbi:XRCC4-like factor-domain-containing protein [Corynascus novoguineensis]|uniref:Non-homologous end-joining factor 1 n=1 Tax=Corynascus novoguineensis TaxID=1126955 RepID=A0AAN7CW89_9PEZI|nr:XRCC4-like factor-domain-containing protein [Corynascus novoguineensis]
MSGHPSWRLLPASAPGIPTLLVSTRFTADSYSIHLSDLANIWVESLDRRPIIKRGMIEDTSIDPSDGPDQIRKMLELLRAAFDASDPEHGNTSLTLTRDDDGDSLVIHVTCILPKPLKPFKWPIQLRKCSQSVLASQLVLPIIQAHDARMREIDQLICLLRDKDAVIARLIDKLEATGTGLEYVFHALSGKRRVTKAIAEEKVKGLAAFSESDFRRKAAKLQPIAQPSDVSALLGSVFGDTGLQYRSDLELQAFTLLEDWWTKLLKGTKVVLSERPEKKRESQAPVTSPEPEPSKDEDDFQVQVTPPGARPIRKRASLIDAVDDNETSDGEDRAEPAPPSTSPAKPKVTSKLGAIGRSTKSTESPPPPKKSQTSAKTQNMADDSQSETASEPDDDATASSPHSSPPKPPPRRGGLGVIGGKSKQQTEASRSTRSPPSEAPAEEPSSQLPRRHKLGVIGKKVASPEPSTATTSEDTRGRSKTPATEPNKEQVRETSQERADRKRAELQREIERRAAAGPAKKKRKF